MDRHALIAGVSGIIGRHLAEQLLATKGWTVVGISRHKHDLPEGVKHISVDLRSDEAVNAAFYIRPARMDCLEDDDASVELTAGKICDDGIEIDIKYNVAIDDDERRIGVDVFYR